MSDPKMNKVTRMCVLAAFTLLLIGGIALLVGNRMVVYVAGFGLSGCLLVAMSANLPGIGCTGNCLQGRRICDCKPQGHVTKATRWTLILVLALMVLLVGGLVVIAGGWK